MISTRGIVTIRHFSSSLPLREVYDSLKPIEHLFEKYQLHRIRDPKILKNLIEREEIPNEMGNRLLYTLEHGLAAESKQSNEIDSFLLFISILI